MEGQDPSNDNLNLGKTTSLQQAWCNIVEFDEDSSIENDEIIDGLFVEKVVTQMNGTIYLYIPKDSKDPPPDLNNIETVLKARSMEGEGFEGGPKCEWGSWSPDSEGRCLKIKDEVMREKLLCHANF